MATVFASAHLADTATTDAAAKVAVLIVMIVVICTTWLVGGTSIAALLRDSHRACFVNLALAVALIGVTTVLLLTENSPARPFNFAWLASPSARLGRPDSN